MCCSRREQGSHFTSESWAWWSFACCGSAHEPLDARANCGWSRTAHLILVMRPHLVSIDDVCVGQVANVYSLRIAGHLGPTALSAFPSMAARLTGRDTLLTGVLDRSALYGVLAEIEALNLDLIELRRLVPSCT